MRATILRRAFLALAVVALLNAAFSARPLPVRAGTNIVQSNTTYETSVTTYNHPAFSPTAPTPGNVLILFVAWSGPAADLTAVPSGWTQEGTTVTNTTVYSSEAALCRIVQTNDTGAVSMTFTGSSLAVSSFEAEVSGSAGGSCAAAVEAIATATSTTTALSVTSGTPTKADLFLAAEDSRANTTGVGSGWTNQASNNNSAAHQTWQSYQATTTAAQTATWNWGAAANSAGVVIGIVPAATAALPNGLSLTGAGGPHQSVAVTIGTPAPTPPPTIAYTHVMNIIGGRSAVAEPTPPATPYPYVVQSPGPFASSVFAIFDPIYSYAKAYNAAGINTIKYDDPMQPYDGSTGGATPGPCSAQTSGIYDCQQLRSGGAYNSVAAHDCSNNLITTYSTEGLAADPTQSSFANYWTADLTNFWSVISGYGMTYQYIFVDNNSGTLGGGFSATPCSWNATTWGQDWAAAATSIQSSLPGGFAGAHFLTNTFGLDDGNQATLVPAYLDGSAVYGGEYEGCVTNAYPWIASRDFTLQAVAYLKAQGRPPDSIGAECYANEQTLDAASNTQARMFVYASWLLTYDLHYSSIMESFTPGVSNITDFPEQHFIPMGTPSPAPSNPIYNSGVCTTTPCCQVYNCNGTTQGSGLYVEYYPFGCYYAPFGASVASLVGTSCEIVVNMTGKTDWSSGAVSGGVSYTIPNPYGYTHQMTLSGSDYEDGGTASFTAAAPTTIGPQSGVILLP